LESVFATSCSHFPSCLFVHHILCYYKYFETIMLSQQIFRLLLCLLLTIAVNATTTLRSPSSPHHFAPKIRVINSPNELKSKDSSIARDCEEQSKRVDSFILPNSCKADPALSILSQDGTSVTFSVSGGSWFLDDCSPLAEATTVQCEDGLALVDVFQADPLLPCSSHTCQIRYAIKCSPSKCETRRGRRLGSSQHD
jgi:hypothetical protein